MVVPRETIGVYVGGRAILVWQRILKNKVSRQLCHGAGAEVVRHATGADVGD